MGGRDTNGCGAGVVVFGFGAGVVVLGFGDGVLVDVRLRVVDGVVVLVVEEDELEAGAVVVVVVVERVVVLELRVVVVVLVDTFGSLVDPSSPKTAPMPAHPQQTKTIKPMMPPMMTTALFFILRLPRSYRDGRRTPGQAESIRLRASFSGGVTQRLCLLFTET